MVEMALIMPLFLLILFGIIQYCLLFSAYMTVRNAAAVAARYAALTQDPEPTQDQVAATARAAVQPALDPARLDQVTVDMNATVGSAGGAKMVTLRYQYPVLISFVIPGASSGQVPISVSAVAR
jgi:Flp pilus assembly protein TadG